MSDFPKKNIIIICLIILTIIIIVFLSINNKKKDDIIQNDPTPTNQISKNVILDINDKSKTYELGKVDIISFRIEPKNEHESHLIILLENTMPEDIDLTKDYMVYVYDKNNNYIIEYSGNALGKIEANSKLNCDLKLDYDASIVGSVVIKKITN